MPKLHALRHRNSFCRYN